MFHLYQVSWQIVRKKTLRNVKYLLLRVTPLVDLQSKVGIDQRKQYYH